MPGPFAAWTHALPRNRAAAPVPGPPVVHTVRVPRGGTGADLAAALSEQCGVPAARLFLADVFGSKVFKTVFMHSPPGDGGKENASPLLRPCPVTHRDESFVHHDLAPEALDLCVAIDAMQRSTQRISRTRG